jgi:pilus assembly protein CpaB
MRTKSIVLLLLALGCGLVASIGISQIMEQNNQGGGAAETQPILVAMKPIAGQEQLKAENVKLEEWPTHLIPKGALTKIEDVEGRRVKFSMVPGDPILENKLVGDEDRRATVDVPPGFRLVAVHADAVSAVGNLIKPGDRVDVLVYLKANNFSGGQEAGATTILQDIKVFAVNDQWRPTEETTEGPSAVKNVALLVTPEQAEKLTLATELGKVKLVLRSPDDDLKADTLSGTTAHDLFGTGDRSSRAAEKHFLAKSGKAAKSKGKGLLGYLGLGSEEGEDGLPGGELASLAPSAGEHFTMQLLEGSAIRSVEFTKSQYKGKNGWQSGDDASSANVTNNTPVADLGEQPSHVKPGNPFAPSLGD